MRTLGLCLLHFTLCPLLFALCTLPSALCPLHSALCPLLYALCSLPSAPAPNRSKFYYFSSHQLLMNELRYSHWPLSFRNSICHIWVYIFDQSRDFDSGHRTNR